MSDRQYTLAVLHDLALVYLRLTHGTDDDLDPAEASALSITLHQWEPAEDPALIDHVIREATLTYLNGARHDRVEEAITTLRDALPSEARQAIVNNLHTLAEADGYVIDAEQDFIRYVADAWGVTAS